MFLKPGSPYHYDELRQAISKAHRAPETEYVHNLLSLLSLDTQTQQIIAEEAEQLIVEVRDHAQERPAIQIFMQQYDLNTEEGIMLMCLAEALLRTPDKATEDLLIRDKLTSASWSEYIGCSESTLVNWATWGLALTGKILKQDSGYGHMHAIWKRFIGRCSEPIVRQAVVEAIKIMSEQFVVGRNMPHALKMTAAMNKKGYLYSFDMLGEVARTNADADKYYAAYQQAIATLGKESFASLELMQRPGISVKLSALYSRYEPLHAELAVPFLCERIQQLAVAAMQAGISLTLDAEEADRLEMSLDIFAMVLANPIFANWQGLGLAVQAYQKRALPVLKWVIALARAHKRVIPVRLVKGAYWDTEIKLSQINGYMDYPVFTRKASTDVSYLVCAKTLLSAPDAIYAQFATHNAYSVAAILQLAKDQPLAQFEFQRLQGMGIELYAMLHQRQYRCRIYAPVGTHEDLLPYLVRRLLENGANSSFVNQIANPDIPIAQLLENPVEVLRQAKTIVHPQIPLPRNLYVPTRINSQGIDLSNYAQLQSVVEQIEQYKEKTWYAFPTLCTRDPLHAHKVQNPNQHDETVGIVWEAKTSDIEHALQQAQAAFNSWQTRKVAERAACLRRAADLLEKHQLEFISLMMREAGKAISDAISEVRETIDYCRYYSHMAEQNMAVMDLLGPTGENNTLQLQGRGIFVCISPWNFPLAIFAGQVVAALVTGNTVIAKPAEQTPLIAARMVDLLYEAGIPTTVLHLLPGRGETVGAALTSTPNIAGVIFTGSTATAKAIASSLVTHTTTIIPFIAETGGINAMIVDSTALPEQVVGDVVLSAFNSAGQRCSALRVLCIQQDIADRVITMLQGAMAELCIGSSTLLTTDVGPVIDESAYDTLLQQCQRLRQHARLIYQTPLPAACDCGYFIAPQLYEITDLSQVREEIFGPVLQVYRYRRQDLAKVIAAINAWGYGLTFGVHSRINASIDKITKSIEVGNVYVNRNMIGAVVGVQPFGGSRLSGTGPKAGGPHYLLRLCHEKTISINTTAMGGNASLMTLK